MNRFKLKVSLLLGLMCLYFGTEAFANASRLESALQTTGTSLKSMAIAALSVGTAISAICFAIGAAGFGRMVLISAITGGVITFGGQSLIEMLKQVFGG